MADYYPVLARAVSSLPINSVQTRQELYDKARSIVEAELRRHDRRKTAREIVHEQATLETAIRRVEAESSSTPPTAIASGEKSPPHVTEELDGVLKSIGLMLLGIAAIAGMVAFTAVIYVHGLMWVYAEVIGYPTLLVAMTIIIGLFVLATWAVLRNIRAEDAIGFLLLLVHTAPKKVKGIAGSRPAADRHRKPQIST